MAFIKLIRIKCNVFTCVSLLTNRYVIRKKLHYSRWLTLKRNPTPQTWILLPFAFSMGISTVKKHHYISCKATMRSGITKVKVNMTVKTSKGESRVGHKESSKVLHQTQITENSAFSETISQGNWSYSD